MTIAQLPARSLQRVHGRGLLLSILEKDGILTKVRVFNDGRFTAETNDWNAYWQPVHELGHEKVEESLNMLYPAWRDYIRSRFGPSLMKEYCFRYFSLLDILLSLRTKLATHAWLHALQITLGFECSGIASATAEDEVLAAGTCSLRNPCYLLTKLKTPDVLDDTRFLPVITVTSTDIPELFYHYRRYSLSPDSPMSLLLYPAVSEAKRSASFRLINSLVGGVSYGVDPRTRERAQRLCQSIIRPIIEANRINDSETIPLEFVDVGAGSGNLSAAICRQIQDLGFKLKSRLWFMDLGTADPSRFFRAREMRNIVDSLSFLGDDYKNWLSRAQPLPAANGLRIALVSKLFNNLSSFSVRYLSSEELFPFLESMERCSGLEVPICLASGGHGVKSLAISNTRVHLQDGRTFAQASLSEFYRGLYLLTRQVDSTRLPEGLFLPVRSFNPECLITLDGKSVISRLAENCDYIIIEDADLRPQDLIDHTTKFSLSFLTICDMTKALRLKGNHLYVIWTKRAINLLLSGERIW